jgi:capsular exopolysaccharide synthesis family protein
MKPKQAAASRGISPSGIGIDWNEIYHLVRERLWLILGCIAAFTASGAIYVFVATPLYDSICTIEVEQKERQAMTSDKQEPNDYRDLDSLNTIEGNLQRVSLLVRVLQRPEAKANAYLAALASDPEAPENAGKLASLAKSFTIKLRRATRLIDIAVEHPDPATAQLLANLLVDEYTKENFQSRSGDYEKTSDFLGKQVQQMKEKLQITETQLQDYARLVDLRTRILAEQKELDLLNERYLALHPKVIQANALLSDLQKQFMDELNRRKAAEAQAAGQPAPVAETVANSDGTIDGQKFDRAMVEEESHYDVLSQEVTTEQTLYDSILDQLKQSSIEQNFKNVNIRLVEAAALPIYPSKPKTFLILLAALFLGCATGFGTALALRSFSSAFRTVDEAEHRLDLPAFGAVPEVPLKTAAARVGASKVPEALLLNSDPSSIGAEAFRTMRASLKLLGRREERRTFLFTSAVPDEGKSFVASNFAVSLAHEGNRVLLIDGDLRKASVPAVFGLPAYEHGLGDYLTENATLAELVVPSPIENLMILPAGSTIPRPAEILSNGNFTVLLEEAARTFDYIVADSAPILAVSDTLLIAEFFQTTTIVVRANRTPVAACLRVLRLLRDARANVEGFILNRVPPRSGYGRHNYYYHYQSPGKYGDVYGSAKKS